MKFNLSLKLSAMYVSLYIDFWFNTQRHFLRIWEINEKLSQKEAKQKSWLTYSSWKKNSLKTTKWNIVYEKRIWSNKNQKIK